MHLKDFLVARIVLCTLVLTIVGLARLPVLAEDGYYSLGANKHLFIDDFLVSQMQNVELTVNPPQRKELGIIADQPWERGGITSYCNVFWDPNYEQYRMYYVPIELDSDPVFRLAMATSTDGINWEKPNLGAVEWNGSTQNNIVIDGQREGTVMIDPNGTPDRRYVYLSSDPTTKTRLFTSADGINWNMQPELISGIHSDSQISSFWDDQRQKYVHYFKLYTPELQRCTARVEVSHVDDPWPSEMPIVLSRDERDPSGMDLYTNSAQKYSLAPDTYVAFPTPYYHYNEEGREYLNDPALANGGKTNDGVIETQLAVSRDGVNWTRYRTPYVPLHQHEELDLKLAMVFPGLIYNENNIYQYYGGYTFTHGDTQARVQLEGRELGGIFRLEQRIDGFVSADFDYEGGVLVTDPFVFDGHSLLLNLNTSASGEARVGILDAQGNPIAGYGVADCRIINGDYLQKTVTWNQGSDVSALVGQPVRLQFDMRGTKLYSFEFLAAPDNSQNITISENFDSEPTTWWGQENRDMPNDFGWSETHYAEGVLGAGVGEIGGYLNRANSAAYWTAVESLDISSDSLSLSGRGRFLDDNSADGNSILGWFDSTTPLNWTPDNYLAIRTDENDVYIEYAAGGGELHSVKVAAALSEASSWSFSLDYNPDGNSGNGVITASINEGPVTLINLAPGDKDLMTDLNRFGLLTLANGGTNGKTVYYDDLLYTKATASIPGDANGDNVVNELDTLVLALNWQVGPDATWAQGDFNGDGWINDADVTLLAANFVSDTISTSTPEPSTAIFIVGLLSTALILRNKQNSH